MVACICKNVKENQVCDAIKAGHCSVKALRDKLGIMTQCGKCAKTTRCLLRKVQATN